MIVRLGLPRPADQLVSTRRGGFNRPRVRGLSDLPVPRTCGIDLDPVGQTLPGRQLAKYGFGGRGPADVAEADEKNPDSLVVGTQGEMASTIWLVLSIRWLSELTSDFSLLFRLLICLACESTWLLRLRTCPCSLLI